MTHHHNTDYAALMRERGFRVTPQRQMILEAVGEGGGHHTPEEIYERVQTKAPVVNRATVYRTLDFLCELRLIAPAEIGGRKLYELVGDEPHHHLVCRQCGREQQIRHDTTRSLFAQIEQEEGFMVDMEHLVLVGLCRDCVGIVRASP